MREWIELSSQGIQDVAVVIIVVSILYGSVRFLLQLLRRVADPYPAYKKLLGRSLLLSLEFLIAADVNPQYDFSLMRQQGASASSAGWCWSGHSLAGPWLSKSTAIGHGNRRRPHLSASKQK